MAAVLAERCREPSWVRTLVAGLDRFRRAHRPRRPGGAAGGGAVRPGGGRPLPARPGARPGRPARRRRGRPGHGGQGLVPAERGAGRLAAPARRHLGQAPARGRAGRPGGTAAGAGARSAAACTWPSCCACGSATSARWTPTGGCCAEPQAEPLAVRYQQRRGRPAERITFLSFAARAAVLEHLERRRLDGLDTGPRAPLVAGPDGRPVGRATVARARRRSNAVIRAGNNLNVDMCRKTGEFFREWGLPGSRFTPTPEGGERP